ncbi:protein serine/threonine phosphatase 2C [Flagelloscypha sp. PMI_526]|nr:protein serine/threonine phosphatase 2C [Flagelloscypha sp. PMI_526]
MNAGTKSIYIPSLTLKPLRLQLARASKADTLNGVHSVSFQPRTKEDRSVSAVWNLANGSWRFLSVFDGHGAGVDCVDNVKDLLPLRIQSRLTKAVGSSIDDLAVSVLHKILVESISCLDDELKAGVTELFYGGETQLEELTDEAIREIVNDPQTGQGIPEIMRARTGTTALVALLSPNRQLVVASLGDCDCGIAMQNKATKDWTMTMLSSSHNTSNTLEWKRILAEHPGEGNAINLENHRVLGLIMVTRALGDMMFKLPNIWTQRVLACSEPPMHPGMGVDILPSRNITPLYLSNIAEVPHIDLSGPDGENKSVLFLASDGLANLFIQEGREESVDELFGECIMQANMNSDNLALDLLWHAIGSQDLVVEMLETGAARGRSRIDDTTIIGYVF